ncbi:5-formyltetrahydrofolate cyclo-ligase [Roseitranquillus sediminis]|uniref:5-formyltetrahydrofolate cyclo-ligase n=1 Tax=Roseitranquillus sediminis TaxID=2809051 RepID=UPI001D0C1A59|nr:5-formyltetrahydrofolate cyclo-ligase [Roseitranquillus sediminis]MBM9595306.1 5-formyltetrahydrofolate cyclo-ligase [Roseitranquillus sediminis]
MKAGLRERAAAARDAAHRMVDSEVARWHLTEALAPWRRRPLAGYLPIRSEIDPRPVMAAWPGPVGVPEIVAKGAPLRFVRWHPEAELQTGTFAVDVPVGAEELVPEVLIVPLLAFDGIGGRLGYGGGFYDRTLAALRRAGDVIAIGFAYAAQEFDEVPLEPTDIMLDAVVTEQGIRWFPR